MDGVGFGGAYPQESLLLARFLGYFHAHFIFFLSLSVVSPHSLDGCFGLVLNMRFEATKRLE